jgi:acyl-CoA thioesterase-2
MTPVLDTLSLAPGPLPDTFVGHNLEWPIGHMFGGQVLAQSVLAAGRTVDAGRLPHSLHGYFLRPGDVAAPIDFEVERMRDGRSFSARRVHASQGDGPILSVIASFQERQPGLEFAQSAPTDVPDPDEVPAAHDQFAAIEHPVARFWTESAFDLRHVGGSLYTQAADEPVGRQLVWMRARGEVPENQLLHRALLAYACDQVMLEPVLRHAGLSWSSTGLSLASLDHAMWWHRDVHVDDWMLFVQSSPSGQGGRGLGVARVFTHDGTLVASIAQEGMVRVPLE